MSTTTFTKGIEEYEENKERIETILNSERELNLYKVNV